MPISTVFLARHGPSASAPRGLLTAAQFGEHLRTYDTFGLAAGCALPDRLLEVAAECDLVVHSPLPRAVETVELIEAAGVPVPRRQAWPDLVEAAQPAVAVPALRLPLDGWDVLTRLAWLAGRPGEVEPRAAAAAGPAAAVRRLEQVGADPALRKVLVVAHGFQNFLLATELRRRGWAGPRWPDHRHGTPTPYRLRTAN